MREFSVPPAATVADRANLTDLVWHNAADHPHVAQFALPGPTGWRDVTCREFRDQVAALARGLIAMGIKPGDRIALMSRTRYEWTLIDFATWSAGAVTVPIYETSTPEQIEWIISDSGAVGCVVETDAHLESLHFVRERLPDLRLIWQIDGRAAAAVAQLTAAGEGVGASEVDRRRAGVGADDPATIIYTSGTTGRPKGCLLTHRNILSDALNAVPSLPEVLHEGASTLLFLPLAHSFARLIQVGVVASRVRTAYALTTQNLVDDLTAFRPTFVLAVPRVFEKVYLGARHRAHAAGRGALFDRAERVAVAYSEALDSRGRPGFLLRAEHALMDRVVYTRLRGALGGRCTSAISGGAPLGPRLGHFFRGAGVTIYEGYGLTETSPAVAVNTTRHIRIGSVGRPLPGVRVRVNNDGEILVAGDVVFAGYWNDPAATAEVKDGDGWLSTGDLGTLGDDGYLTITGRSKEIIVTASGKNVAPPVLEDRVRAHSLVSQCMVVGDHRPFVGALITIDEEAFTSWKARHGKAPGATVADLRTDADLRAAIQAAVDDTNQAVSRAESIRVFRILAGDFTETNGMLTPSLKVKRTVVAKEHADEIAAIYS